MRIFGLPLTERIRRNSTPDEASGCWVWQGSKGPSGYGMMSAYSYKTMRAHRAAWLAFRGEIPDGMHVLHRCDVRACVNPEHLFLGTHTDNMRDMVAKGRIGRRDYNRGSGHGMSKLTEADVLEMRRLRTGGMTQAAIARRYGIALSTANQIVNGRRWRHI